MRIALKTILIISVLLIVGCGHAGDVAAPGVSGDGEYRTLMRPPQLDRWAWGTWVFSVNEDHTSLEAVPVRGGALHYNVLKFVEGFPCPNCMTIGSPQPQGDGTFKVKVMLQHPFPGLPQYTGFDVRGTVVFPSTHYWYCAGYSIEKWKGMGSGGTHYDPIPLYFSRASAGGGEVLNADGYSFYFFPGFIIAPDVPILSYQDGKHATGDEGELDGTVNPFIEFHDVDERRMFTSGGLVTRTYHIKPPEGAFKFGYIVDASWALPIKTPVTDPATDFPDWANAEEGISLGATQIAPIVSGESLYEVVEWKIRHRHIPDNVRINRIHVIVPDLKDIEPWQRIISWDWQLHIGEHELIDPWTSVFRAVLFGMVPEQEPGYYPALCISATNTWFYLNGPEAHFSRSPAFEFIDLYVEG